MPIGFHCTGCRARLHVPRRWRGNTLSCPRCGTRVVVPAGGDASCDSPFEGRSVERSLAALYPAPAAAGTFGEESFAVPAPAGPPEGPSGRGEIGRRFLLSRGAIYAVAAVVPPTAIGSFLLGCWWTARRGRSDRVGGR